MKEKDWVPAAAKRARFRLEKDILPVFGTYPVADLTAPDVLNCLRRVEARGVGETAQRCKTLISGVLRMAVAEGYTESDVTVSLGGASMPKSKPKSRAAPTTACDAKQVWRTIRDSDGNRAMRGVLLMGLLTLQRNTEICDMKWADIEGDTWVNRIGKNRIETVVPLPTQALAVLDEMRGWDETFVFPGRSRTGQISVVAQMNYLRDLGFDTKSEVSMHGFRATGRTLLDQELEYPPHWIERQLGQVPKSVHCTAYDRAKYLRHRISMMQAWADWLDTNWHLNHLDKLST